MYLLFLPNSKQLSNNEKVLFSWGISNLNDSVIKGVQVEQPGEGTLQIGAGSLSTGNYTYTLIVDGKVVDTKQMVLMR